MTHGILTGRALGAATLGTALLLGASGVLAQGGTAQARVLSSTPLTEQGQVSGYSVEYEYDGQRYTTRTQQPPGATLPVQVTSMGVSTYPVAPQATPSARPLDEQPGVYGTAPAPGAPAWAHVQPQPGVVLSAGEAPQAAYPAPAVSYYPAPPPVVYGAPVYGTPVYAYPQAQPWVYPPVNLSFNLGYSRGWGGHGYRGRHGYYGRGWR
ncbi:hypothetical protein PGB34_09415 [Xenophilus arseniciresistens]|uniref:Uncharacterized protein n=1 Tax=Xenophilus arseniciresistens TaxID=1283306 RepID=A0AAE3SYX9_9BURK|nr:hypothetical protein [Xenophilus arseniciresistens]MDA7416582.1 hypothetical protein [Xenophilus arseniciresistens]